MPEPQRPYFDKDSRARREAQRAASAREFEEAVWRSMWLPVAGAVKGTFGTFKIICNDGSKIEKGGKKK